MSDTTLYVGLDTDKKHIDVAVAEALPRGEVRYWGRIANEAMRDLVRAREASVEDLGRCRQRISSFLLRQDIGYVGKPWTRKHRIWLGQHAFGEASHGLMFAELLDALDQAQARRDRLTDHIAELVPDWSLSWLVEALQVLRGYRLIDAVAALRDQRDRAIHVWAVINGMTIIPAVLGIEFLEKPTEPFGPDE